MTSRLSLAGGLVVIALLFASAGTLQAVRARRYPAPPVTEESLYVTSVRTVERLTIGYSALAADLYWIRAIQHYGGEKRRLADLADAGELPESGQAYRLLYPLLDLTTSLDPHFNIAYRFGAIFLTESYPGGAGRPDLAIALLEKGLRERPDKWEYMWDIGFVHYWWKHDYQSAAAWFEKASRVPGAPWWLQSLAANTLTQGGNRQASRAMWMAIRDSAEVEYLRNDASRRLSQLDALDLIDQLQQRVDTFALRAGRSPADWQDLVQARLLPGIPLDPAQVPFVIDPSGRVAVSTDSPLFPLPVEPQPLQSLF